MSSRGCRRPVIRSSRGCVCNVPRWSEDHAAELNSADPLCRRLGASRRSRRRQPAAAGRRSPTCSAIVLVEVSAADAAEHRRVSAARTRRPALRRAPGAEGDSSPQRAQEILDRQGKPDGGRAMHTGQHRCRSCTRPSRAGRNTEIRAEEADHRQRGLARLLKRDLGSSLTRDHRRDGVSAAIASPTSMMLSTATALLRLRLLRRGRPRRRPAPDESTTAKRALLAPLSAGSAMEAGGGGAMMTLQPTICPDERTCGV